MTGTPDLRAAIAQVRGALDSLDEMLKSNGHLAELHELRIEVATNKRAFHRGVATGLTEARGAVLAVPTNSGETPEEYRARLLGAIDRVSTFWSKP